MRLGPLSLSRSLAYLLLSIVRLFLEHDERRGHLDVLASLQLLLAVNQVVDPVNDHLHKLHLQNIAAQ